MTRCSVCMHHCKLNEGQWGLCRARKNVKGVIRCANYGRITAKMLDPIEKKPFQQFYPGRLILSVGSFGCNLRCPFCQNYEISMQGPRCESTRMTPEELVKEAVSLQRYNNIGIAFTYNEPLIGYEFVRDTARLLHEEGMQNVVVTNGAFTEKVLDEILPYIDAMNIDLKAFTRDYYRQIGGDLETVKRFIKKAHESCHVELTNLIVPDENDTVLEIQEMAEWIASIDKKIPLHLTRFFPKWKMKGWEPTDVLKIYELAEKAERYLEYVYPGNCS